MAGRTTYRYVVFDILTSLKSTFPDAEIQENHVLYWVGTVANLIRKRHLNRLESGAYLVNYENVPVMKSGIRRYVELPSAIYDMFMEKGVEYLSYQRSDVIAFTQVFFQPTTPSQSFRLYYSPYETPTPSNPYFYRVDNKLWLLGVSDIKLTSVEMGLFSAIDPRSSMIDLDTEIPLNEDQIHQLRIEVLNMGRYVLMIPSERDMEGADTRLQGQASKLRSTITSSAQNQPPSEEQTEVTPE